MIDKNNTQSTLHFLINADFTPERGYSYGELITFLKTFQTYYRECYIKKDQYEQELKFKNKTFELVETKIINIEKLLKEKEKENNFLITKVDRKLTFWERITGKLNIKY
jgi:hypothetical protein